MTLVISILFRVVGYGLILASLWYTPFRLGRLWGMQRAWPLCILVAIGVILAVAGMVSLSASANAVVGVDLMLSGHTHAGQMFPATLINNYLFPLNKGLHQKGDTTFFVSQGAGTYGPRIRLGSNNEVNLIRLLPDK